MDQEQVVEPQPDDVEDEEISEGPSTELALQESDQEDQTVQENQELEEDSSQFTNQFCIFCTKTLSSKQALIRHLNSEKKKLTKSLPGIDKRIDKMIDQLKERTKSIPDRLQCIYCHQTYSNKYYRHRHELKCRQNPKKSTRIPDQLPINSTGLIGGDEKS